MILNRIKKQLVCGNVHFNTLLIGGNSVATRIFKETPGRPGKCRLSLQGFLAAGQEPNGIREYLPQFGSYKDMSEVIDERQIKLVVIAVDKNEKQQINHIVEVLSEKDVDVKIVPDTLDILSGSSYQQRNRRPAFRYPHRPDAGMATEYQTCNRCCSGAYRPDNIIAFLAYVALRVKFSSAGPILYSQERVGYRGRRFHILKFRSMYHPAGSQWPATLRYQ